MWIGNTNGSRFEVYAILGEVYGSGMPLGYLLIQSNGGEKGAKERYIGQFLDYLKKNWDLRACFTLTDKDWSEIKAFLAKFPEAKHQLCFWHCLRAIKKRLSILRRAPAFYDVKEAKKEFAWIDELFVPVQQRSEESLVSIHCRIQPSSINDYLPSL
jgi:MULE transposase domain